MSGDARLVELAVAGPDLDLTTRDALIASVRDVMVANAPDGPAPDWTLVLDLTAVEFMDSTGLGSILTARTAVVESGGSLRLRGVSDLVRRIIAFVGLSSVLPIEDPR